MGAVRLGGKELLKRKPFRPGEERAEQGVVSGGIQVGAKEL